MKILSALRSGLSRTIKAWRSVLIYWFVSFLLVSLIVTPLRSSLNATLDKSMITEKLATGLDVDVLGDMGTAFRSMSAALFSGFIILLLVASLTNVFISGGIFDSVRSHRDNEPKHNFFSACSSGFWSFLIITLVSYLMIIAILMIVIIIPVAVGISSFSDSEGSLSAMLKETPIVFAALLAIILLIADYARAWQSANEGIQPFKAIGFGFRQAFGSFTLSFPLMILILVIKTGLIFLIYKLVAGITPVTDGGLIWLFFISQLLEISNVVLRVFRYASVTSLLELRKPVPQAGEIEQERQVLISGNIHDIVI
jgi:hypothetical protein